MNFLLRYLRDDDLFLDIGANIGVYTLLAASKIKQANIYSIEALPKNYARLEQNIKLNNFEEIKSFLLAVSNRTGKIELNLAEGDSMPYITSKASEKTISVNTQTLDSLLINRNINNFTLAKIDIEGAEILALEGAVSLLKQQRPRVWIMEINNTINNFGHSKQTIVDFLDKYGYKLYHYDATNNQLSCIDVDRQRDNNVLVIADNSINFVRDRLNI
jgi:FkbM family methyltransferase